MTEHQPIPIILQRKWSNMGESTIKALLVPMWRTDVGELVWGIKLEGDV